MCTVTLIPIGNINFVLTSNRDEAPHRTTLSPDFYEVNKTKLLFPKDKVAGGSWIGVSDKKRVLCVLNGGYDKHERKASYRMSRGVVMRDLLITENLDKAIHDYNFEGIEPFTLVIVEWSSAIQFKELVWDGINKHFSSLPFEPKIWSSSTLYNDSMKKERLQWFQDFNKEHSLSSNAIMEFHKTAGKGNDDYGVVMDRFFVKTTSITQITKTQNKINMHFENLQLASTTEHNFQFPLSVNE
jgi:hypothetical protein